MNLEERIMEHMGWSTNWETQTGMICSLSKGIVAGKIAEFVRSEIESLGNDIHVVEGVPQHLDNSDYERGYRAGADYQYREAMKTVARRIG